MSSIRNLSTTSSPSPKSAMLREAVLFGLVGIANTAVGYGTILVLMAANIGPVAANIGGYVLGLCCSYVLNSRVTFDKRRQGRGRVLRFLAVFAVCWLFNLGVLTLTLTHLPVALAQLAAMVAYTTLFFFLSRAFVFGER